jgi:hypothetical protein
LDYELESGQSGGCLRQSDDDSNARNSKLLQSDSSARLGFGIQAASDKASQLAFYLASSGGAIIQIVDQQSGKIVLRKEIENLSGVNENWDNMCL